MCRGVDNIASYFDGIVSTFFFSFTVGYHLETVSGTVLMASHLTTEIELSFIFPSGSNYVKLSSTETREI